MNIYNLFTEKMYNNYTHKKHLIYVLEKEIFGFYPSEYDDNINYKCNFCHKKFSFLEDLFNHYGFIDIDEPQDYEIEYDFCDKIKEILQVEPNLETLFEKINLG